MNQDEIDLLLMDTIPEYEKPDRKQRQKGFMKHANGLYWLNSPDKEWEEKAKASYLKISERQTWKRK